MFSGRLDADAGVLKVAAAARAAPAAPQPPRSIDFVLDGLALHGGARSGRAAAQARAPSGSRRGARRFTKLDIRSRRELRGALRYAGQAGVSA
jgi:hypothetical protein